MKRKICSKCGIEKELINFYRNNTKKSGFQSECKDCKTIIDKKHYEINKDRIIYRIWNYYLKNKKKINEYNKNRIKTDINFKLKKYLRIRLCEVLKGNPKIETTMKLVGCSIENLKQYLQTKFQEGMSWQNYGKWHIDHIKSCCTFDLSNPEEQKICFHYTNLQPLWAEDNLSKGKK